MVDSYIFEHTLRKKKFLSIFKLRRLFCSCHFFKYSRRSVEDTCQNLYDDPILKIPQDKQMIGLI